MTKREAVLKKISTNQFAAHDMQLYLDTHPDDAATIEKMNGYKANAAELIAEYEKEFGPLTKKITDGNQWSWIKGPWPWESGEDD